MTGSSGDAMETERAETSSSGADRAVAANEVGAAIAHQLYGPLTALLLYLEDLCESRDRFPAADGDGPCLKEVAENALREAECVCSLVQRLGETFEAPLMERTAFAQGREIIRWWLQAGNANDEAQPAPAPAARPQSLTAREHQVLGLIREGYSNKEGAARLQISPRTYEGHRAALMRKYNAKNLADLLRLAAQDHEAADAHLAASSGRRQAMLVERCREGPC